MLINLGLIDIFRLLGQVSKKLQTVELFPWEIIGTQTDLIRALRGMAELRLTDFDGEAFEYSFDKVLWASLAKDG